MQMLIEAEEAGLGSFHSKFNLKIRGTAILIHKDISFEAEKIVEDPCGSYVVVTGKLLNKPVILANIYTPNWDVGHFLIIVGDFNCILSPELDRSAARPRPLSKTAKAIHNYPGGLISQPEEPFLFSHQFTVPILKLTIFFSTLALFLSLTASHIIITDNAPLSFELSFLEQPAACRAWRLNSLLLSDSKFTKFVITQIKFFIETNAIHTRYRTQYYLGDSKSLPARPNS